MVAERSFLPPDQTMSYHHHSNNTHQWNQPPSYNRSWSQHEIYKTQSWNQHRQQISPQPWKQPRFNSKPHNPCPFYNRPNSMETRRASSGQQTLGSSLEQSLKKVQQSLDKVKQLLDKLPPGHQQAEIQPMKSAFSTPTEPSYTTLDLKTIKERKAAGLCEYCELKFFNGHKCKSSQLFLIVLGDEEQDPSEYGLLDEGVEKEQKEMGNLCVEKDEDKQKVEDDEKKQKVDDSIFHHLEGAVDCAIKEEEILVNCATREEVLAPVEQRSGYNLLEVLSFVLRSQLKSNLLQIEPLSSGEQNQRLHHVEVSPRLPHEQQRVMPKMDEEHLGFVIPIPTESASKNMSENSQANFEIMLLTTTQRKIEKAKLLRKDYKEKYKDELCIFALPCGQGISRGGHCHDSTKENSRNGEVSVQNAQPTIFQQESAFQIEEVYILEFEDVQRSLSNHTALVQIESEMMLIDEEPTTSLLYAIKKVRLGIG